MRTANARQHNRRLSVKAVDTQPFTSIAGSGIAVSAAALGTQQSENAVSPAMGLENPEAARSKVDARIVWCRIARDL